ncbi:MAG TPA: NAD-dependent epimerase/dehydratase family protein [Candidatus Paceibacterota bacterium]|nr:NAD-dependent epimerase/dehydratase family protein [Candidatus Paceibacterota bacterium]
MKNQNFWYGKRVLVTGADGFVAANLIKKLLGLGAVVVGTVRHNRPIKTLELLDEGEEKSSSPDIEFNDLLDFAATRRICDRHQIDTIFHLAAISIVSNAANSPISTIENNVETTLNLLEVARTNNIPRVVIVSTDKVYGDHANDTEETLPYREHYALRGLDVYSSSKVAADMIAQTYAYQYKLPVMITRACNIYGPGDLNFTRLIPRTIMRLMEGKAPVINIGNEHVLREYIYVDDVVDAYLLLAEKTNEYYGQNLENMPSSGAKTYGWSAFNIGNYDKKDLAEVKKCDRIQSVTDIIALLGARIKKIEPVIIPKPVNFIEIPDQYADASKIRQLGFSPKTTMSDGIAKTVAWYTKHQEQLAPLAEKYMN